VNVGDGLGSGGEEVTDGLGSPVGVGEGRVGCGEGFVVEVVGAVLVVVVGAAVLVSCSPP
jgi:hypothetical protein